MTSPTQKKKPGKLSNSEMDFITKNSRRMSKEQIASHLNRTVEPIDRYIIENDLPVNTDDEDREFIKRRLISRFFWKSIKDQLDSDEVEYFIEGWISLMEQYNNDVTATEEQEIKQLLISEISMNRCGKQKRDSANEIEEIQTKIKNEEALGAAADIALIARWSQQLNYTKSNISMCNLEIDKYTTACKDIRKSLKSTRDQRIKQVESGQSTFMTALKHLSDQKNRENAGREMELLKIATDKKRNELYELHTYDDGVLDPPILNCDSYNLGDPIEQHRENPGEQNEIKPQQST